MAPPSLTKKTFSELCKRGLGGEHLYFLSFMILVLIGDPTSDGSRPDIPTKRADTRSYGLWLMSCVGRINKLSSHPHEGKICVLFSLCQNGHFGNRNGSRVWAWLGWLKKHRLTGVGPQRGFTREPLGEPSKLSSCGIRVTTSSANIFNTTIARSARVTIHRVKS